MIIEGLAVIFTLVCVWLAAKRHVLSWPIGMIAAVFYAIVFYDTNLYADFALQFVFFIQGIIGWMFWKRNLEKESQLIKIESMNLFETFKWFFISIIGVNIVFLILINYTNASAPLLDSIVAVNSLIANWLLAKRKLQNWILWIIIDVIYIGLFIYKGLYLSAGLYLILGVMAYLGLKNWLKIVNNY